MSYVRTTWVDSTTPVDASRLNNIEEGILAVAVQPAKINASLINSWVGTAWYFKDTIGFVHLYISVSGGTDGWTIATLPAGYRPAANIAMVGINTSTKAAILGEIQTNGNIEGDNPTAGCLYSPPPYLPA